MHQGNHRDHEGAKKLFELIKDVKIAMMTTVDSDGTLNSRPMWNNDADENGDLWDMSKISQDFNHIMDLRTKAGGKRQVSNVVDKLPGWARNNNKRSEATFVIWHLVALD